MTVKKKWTVIPGFLALAAAATLLSAYSGASSSQGLRVEQPVKFVHAPHVAKAGMNESNAASRKRFGVHRLLPVSSELA